MTDTMFTRTALTEAAEKAGVTTDQARAILEAAGVKVEREKPALPTEPGDVIIATEVRGVKYDGPGNGWRMFLDIDGDWLSAVGINGRGRVWHAPKHITAWTEAVVVPAGKPIDPDDVRVGDRVRLVLDSGDEVTITAIRVNKTWVESRYGVYARHMVRAVYLLGREGEG